MNYRSDLDMIFIYDGPEGSREYFTRVAQRMITVLTSPTGEGVLYRIDMRLRPSGQAGPLVTTLESFETYHRERAMLWEQQAMVKARWVAGDEEFRDRVSDVLAQLTYSRRLDAEGLDEIVRVRRRKEAGGDHYDIKAGQGGLVDVEFAVQALQLVHGKDHPPVRTPSTLGALKALSETGLVDEKQYNTLRRAYLFYREIENRSQIYQDRSDPRIPRDVPKALPLAKRLGYGGEEEGGRRFLEEVASTRDDVRKTFEGLVVQMKKAQTGTGG